MRVYIAGPYSAPTATERIANVDRALIAAKHLLDAGHAPFVPHLSHYFDQWLTVAGDSLTYEQYMAWDDAYLFVCDAVLFLGHSPGADRERVRAESLGIPIYERVEDVPSLAGVTS